MRQLKVLVILLLVSVLAPAAGVSAQTTTGSMSGTVIDATGQVVPGADVIITHEQTGEQRRGVTNEVGDFTFPALQPGSYTVRAELTGFRPIERTGNMVLANNRVAVPPLQLEVGSLAEAVTVSAVGQVVATTQTSHQAILDLKQVENLSIRGRDPISLLKILPGVSLLANDQETFGGSFATPVPAIQGVTGGNTLYVDGVNGGDGGGGGGGGGNFSAATNVDAIAEVNVQMSAYTAEYGLKGGAQVNIITKHGGSEYHGSGYWYKRHEAWNATNFFNNLNRIPKPQYRYSTLGGTVGGPIPRIKKINANGNKLFFFYSIDDTRLKDVNTLKFYQMPTALERAGDFSQSVRPNGTLIVVRDPLTGQPFPGNVIPANRLDPRGIAMLNLFPSPNTFGVRGYNYVVQEPSIDHPRQQHLIRTDYRPTEKDSIAFKYQTFYTKSVGINVAGASARWGLVRQRYDFFVDMSKLDYTRIINTSTILEFSTGFFSSVEDGPPEDDTALRGIQRSTYPQLNRLGQFASRHNPLGLIPRAQFGNVPSADRNSSNDGGTGQITYDGRWPITGNDIAVPVSINLTHTRGKHTYKLGILREDELFGQARSGTFAGEFDFAEDANDPLNAGYAYANAVLGHARSYTESLGRVPDDRRQKTWAWFVQDTWKIHRKLTLDIGLRMYKWGPPLAMAGEGSGFSFERFDPSWGGNPPVFFRPVLIGTQRRAQNPLTGEILPQTYIGLIVPGTGYSCGVITPDNPCKINGIVTQDDGNYLEDADRGFTEPVPLQFDPRFGVAWAINPKTVVRVSGGSFHDSAAGLYLQQGGGNVAFRHDRIIRFTDLDSYLTGSAATSVVPNTTGVIRTDTKRPNNIRFTAAIQRELGRNIVLDAAYVGSRTSHVLESFNHNLLPPGVRFRPESRDPTVTPTATNPGALPDAYLRPYLGFSDINIASSTGRQTYDSLQVQMTRRFTGRFEMAGSYTWARGYEHGLRQNSPLPSTMDQRDIQEHVLVASYMYEVPGGSRLFSGTGVAKAILDNWRISGISTFATGGRGDITATYSPDFDFSGGGEICGGIAPNPTGFRTRGADGTYGAGDIGQRPYNVVGEIELPRGDRSIDRWFNADAIKPASGRGDVGNDCSAWKFAMPGFNNHDLSFFKDFRVKGNQTIQYRWEIYNVLNSVSFQTVNTAATFNPTTGAQTNPNFGKVTAARNERRMQMSIRYIF
jgi:carboxypeptidase family protein